ncbi:MAG TPA: N-acetylmuramoyl-L-alanine amidase [Trebonia sp.]
MIKGHKARAMGRKTATVIAGVVATVLVVGIMLPREDGTATETVRQAAVGEVHTGSLSVRTDRPAATETPVDPALFSTGSCVTFPPDNGPNATGKTVFLDAGHGGMDPGGVGVTQDGTQVTEAQVNLPIEMAAMRALTADGYRVVVSRTTWGTVRRLGPGDTDGRLLTVAGSHAEVEARDICANMGHANLLVGVYENSGGGGAAGAVTGWDSARSFSRSNYRFATLLQSDVLGELNHAGYGIPDGGVQDDSQLGSTLSARGRAYGHLVLLGPPMAGYVTTPSQMPGALIEPLFITDPFEASVADSSRGQRLIADGIAKAVSQYFSG